MESYAVPQETWIEKSTHHLVATAPVELECELCPKSSGVWIVSTWPHLLEWTNVEFFNLIYQIVHVKRAPLEILWYLRMLFWSEFAFIFRLVKLQTLRFFLQNSHKHWMSKRNQIFNFFQYSFSYSIKSKSIEEKPSPHKPPFKTTKLCFDHSERISTYILYERSKSHVQLGSPPFWCK